MSKPSFVLRLALPILLIFALSGCSAYMAAKQPAQKNFQMLKVGTPRNLVIAEFGTPIHAETASSGKKDIYKFTQGYHGAVRAGRAVGHAVASVATLGLWEVVGTPIEGYANGTELSIEVSYDAEDRISQVVPLKGAEEVERNLNPPPPEASKSINSEG